MGAAVLGASVASFWLALLLMSLFAVQLGWLPLLGAAGWRNYVMPSVVLAALPAALIARMTRAGTVEVLRLDYIRTAWAKGLPPRTVYTVHALRNVLVPVITVVGLNFGSLVGGAVVTESVFNWPGLGRLLVDSVRYRARRPRSLLAGAARVRLGAAAAAGAPLLAPADPYAQDLANILLPPGAGHPFGTDAFGRDILARVLYGARLSLLEVASGVSLAVAVGVPLGLLAGTAGGALDAALMWVMDIAFAFPAIVLAILIVSVLGPSLVNLLLAVAAFSVPVYARLSRNLAMGVRALEFVDAAAAAGSGRWRIIRRHIAPNTMGPVLVQATLTAGTAVLSAASLSFLGLGAQPPLPEWGTMLSDGRNYLGVSPWLCFFPGAAVMVTVLGFNLLGDGLRDVLDPRQ